MQRRFKLFGVVRGVAVTVIGGVSTPGTHSLMQNALYMQKYLSIYVKKILVQGAQSAFGIPQKPLNMGGPVNDCRFNRTV